MCITEETFGSATTFLLTPNGKRLFEQKLTGLQQVTVDIRNYGVGHFVEKVTDKETDIARTINTATAHEHLCTLSVVA